MGERLTNYLRKKIPDLGSTALKPLVERDVLGGRIPKRVLTDQSLDDLPIAELGRRALI
jgi:hypothetical protein